MLAGLRAALGTAINSATVTLQANTDITINDNVTAANNGLTLQAGRSIAFELATPRAIRDDSGAVVEFHDHVRDITARKAAEREQAELVETLKLAESIASVGHSAASYFCDSAAS